VVAVPIAYKLRVLRNWRFALPALTSVRLSMLAGLLAMAASSSCEAAGKLPYGSRAGMTVTITDMDGIDTGKAAIKIRHTREDAKQFCIDYLGHEGDECIGKVLADTRISDSIKGDCGTGQFLNLDGHSLTFAGPNFDYDAVKFSPEYRIFKKGARIFLDGSMASGYGVNLEQFRALCPTKFIEAERTFASRPKYVGRWYFGSEKVCGQAEGEADSLLVYKAKEFIAVDTYCMIKSVRANGNRYDLTMTCNAEGENLGVEQQTLEVKQNKLDRTAMDGRRPVKFTYTRCPF
jgi:hypothetical protein